MKNIRDILFIKLCLNFLTSIWSCSKTELLTVSVVCSHTTEYGNSIMIAILFVFSLAGGEVSERKRRNKRGGEVNVVVIIYLCYSSEV